MKSLKTLLLAAASLGVALTTAGPAFAGGGYGHHGYYGSKFHGSKFRGSKFRGGGRGFYGPRYYGRGYYRGYNRGFRGYRGYRGKRYYRGRGFGPGDAALVAGGIIGGAILLDSIEDNRRYRERRAYEAGVRRGQRYDAYDLERELEDLRARQRALEQEIDRTERRRAELDRSDAARGRGDLGRGDARPGFGDEDIPSELLEAERRKLDDERAALEEERRALRDARRRLERDDARDARGVGRSDNDDFDNDVDDEDAFDNSRNNNRNNNREFDGAEYDDRMEALERERNRDRSRSRNRALERDQDRGLGRNADRDGDDFDAPDFESRDVAPSPIRPAPEDDLETRDRDDPLDDELLGGDALIRIAYRGCAAETRAETGRERMIAALPAKPSNVRMIPGGVYHLTASFTVQDPRGGQYQRMMSCKADSRGVMQLELI